MLNIDIRNVHDALHKELPTDPYIFISVLGPNEKDLALPPDKSRVATLKLHCLDTTMSTHKYAFTPEQAEAFIRSVENYRDKISTVVLVSPLGQSRSGALGVFLAWRYNGIFKEKTQGIPNSLIVNTLIQTYKDLHSPERLIS